MSWNEQRSRDRIAKLLASVPEGSVRVENFATDYRVRRDVEIGVRRLEDARRMVVDEHLAARCESGKGEHAHRIAARDDARREDDAFRVHGAGETHFPPAGEPNRRSDRPCGR